MNTKKIITHAIGIFVGLTTAGVSVILSAQVIPDVFAQTVMVALGSAIFSAGLTFFLVRITALDQK